MLLLDRKLLRLPLRRPRLLLRFLLGFLLIGQAAAQAGKDLPTIPSDFSGQQPNFLILLTDDQRFDTIGVNNPELPMKTPAIDRLADSGINFTNGFVTTPICAVSRLSILSGRYARNARVHYFLIPLPEDVFATSYPAVLKNEGGYFLGQLGKFGLGATKEQQAFFDFFDGDLAQGEAFKNYQGRQVHDSEWLTLRTRDFLDTVPPNQPFVLQVNYKAPHPSAAVAPEDKGKLAHAVIPRQSTDTSEDGATVPMEVRRGLGGFAYAGDFGTDERRHTWVRRYLEKIISVDRSVGAIMAELEERGLAENTVVVFLSDHGTHFGEKQLTGKWTPYDPSLQIPFIVYDPRQPLSAGTVNDALVLNIDIGPTLVDLAGLPIPEAMDGVSIAPLLRGERPADWRTHFFFEHFTAPATVPRPLARSIGVRTETDKYLIWSDTKPQVQEYYNLVNDPIERFNRFHVDTERSHFLRDIFKAWDEAHPRNYDYMTYTHRPQVGSPHVDFERMRQVPVLRSHFERINAAREKRGVTWEQALNNPEMRWQIGVEATYFY